MDFVPVMIFFLFISKFSCGSINVSSSLTAAENSSWTSSSGDFAFGFQRLDYSKQFLLAIWFNKIPDGTVVWYANGGNPVPSGSKVELTAASLVLTDPEGIIIWEAKPGATISSAEMLDTGNFVLSGNDSTYVWESFRNPTDTILPSQILNLGDKLFSRLTETNFSRGRFELQLEDGKMSLVAMARPSQNQYRSYFDSGTDNANPSESGYQLVFNRSGAIYIVRRNGDVAEIPNWASMNYSEDFYYRATLDFDGVFAQYLYPKNSSSANPQVWLAMQSIPKNICTKMWNDIGSGPCGFNSYCTLNNSRPSCDCLPGYVFNDPANRFGGCKPTYPQGCAQGDESRNLEDIYEFRELENVDFPMSNYDLLSPYNETQCKDACLHDCDCAVAILEGNNKCWKKRLPLSMGRTTGTYFKMLLKVRKQVPPLGFPNSYGKRKKPILLGVLLGGSSFINLLLSVIISSLYLLLKRQRQLLEGIQDSRTQETNLRFVTYRELEEATNGFKEELGRGGFGIVYKGALKLGSKKVVAVKKLDKLAQDGEKEFRTEVKAISSSHHKNLVKLLGYCDEGSHRLLIYEFMSNGTLADLLFDLPRPYWDQRVKIALGTARGLLYLHEDCDVPIIHCDIKPQNILLDVNLTPKISDFGLAKLLLSNQTRTKTMEFEEERAILTDWAYDCLLSRRLDILVENDEEAMRDKERVEKWAMIRIWCIQEDPSKRPTMKMVVKMLEGLVNVSLPPTPSFVGLSIENSFED